MQLEERGTGPKKALGDCSCSLALVWRGVCCMLSGLILSIIARIRTAVRIGSAPRTVDPGGQVTARNSW